MSSRLKGKRAQIKVRWSKEYVEHLRAVHFALIAASAGLIILVLTKPYDARRALEETQKILEMEKSWRSDWMRKPLAGVLPTKVIRPRGVQLAKENSGEMVTFSRVVQVKVPNNGETVTGGDVLELTLNGAWMPDPSWTLERFPSNLGELRIWWNDLARPRTAAFAASLLRACVAFDTDAEAPLPCVVRADMRGRILTDYAVDQKSKLVGEAYLDQFANFGRLLSSKADYYDMGTRAGYWFTAPYADNKRMVRVYASYSIFTLDRSLVACAFGLKTGPFDSAFHDLALAARGSESLSFGNLGAQLAEEVARGGETFEAFGLKLPGDQVTSFGVGVLLFAELYLLLYLRQFAGRNSAGEDGWNIPWMALEGSWLGDSMFAASLMIAPVAVGLLCYRVLRAPSASYPTWLAWVSFVVPTLLSAGLAVGCWVYRPLEGAVEPPVARSQPFE